MQSDPLTPDFTTSCDEEEAGGVGAEEKEVGGAKRMFDRTSSSLKSNAEKREAGVDGATTIVFDDATGSALPARRSRFVADASFRSPVTMVVISGNEAQVDTRVSDDEPADEAGEAGFVGDDTVLLIVLVVVVVLVLGPMSIACWSVGETSGTQLLS